MHIAAVVVARGGSRRLPGKALRPFGGSTLIGHKIDTLRACSAISSVIVGSDSEAILDEGKRHGAIPLRRDACFCDEKSRTANDMIADMVSRVAAEVIVWAHPTNPLVRTETYSSAVAAYQNRLGRFDSLVSVTAVQRHAWWRFQPLNHDPFCATHAVGAALEPVLFQDGAIFIQSREQLLKAPRFCGDKPYLFTMDPLESTDIDTEADYVTAKALYERYFDGQSS